MLLLLAPSFAQAANRYWIGVGGNWSSTANWATNSAGTTGASVPVAADVAIFDASSGDCTINANASVSGIQLLAGYTGTVTQGAANTVTVSGNYVQEAGTFIGGSNTFTLSGISGSLTITGGSFQPGNAQRISIGGRFAVAGSSFVAGNSQVRFETASSSGAMSLTNTAPGDIVLANVYMASTAANESRSLSINSGVSVVVTGTLQTAGSRTLVINGLGSLQAKGDVVIGTKTYGSGTVVLQLTGTGDQTLTGSGGSVPTLVVDKPSGTLYLEGTVEASKAVSFISGNVVAAQDSTLVFQSPFAPQSITGSVTLANATFGNSSTTGGRGQTIAAGTTITVTNLLSFSSVNRDSSTDGPGTIHAKGDVQVDGWNYGGGSLAFTINGTGDQTLSGSGGRIPLLVVDKPSGTLNLGGTVGITKNLSFVNGNVVAAHDSTVQIAINTTSFAITGSVTLANVGLVKPATAGGYSVTLSEGTVITVTNVFTVGAFSASLPVNGPGKFELQGDMVVQAGSTGYYLTGGAGVVLTYNGDAVQTFTAAAGATSKVRVPFIINKTGGELYLASDWDLAFAGQTMTLTNGVLNLGTNDLRLTASSTDFKMTSANTELRATLTDLRPRLAVTRNTTINGTLRFNLLQGGFMPEITDVIPLITSGNAVSGTFAQTIGQRNSSAVKHDVLYNDGGNNVKLTGIRLLTGTMIIFH
jgi:hypothetical protein